VWCDSHGLRGKGNDYSEAIERVKDAALEEIEDAFLGVDVGPISVEVALADLGSVPTFTAEYADKSLGPVILNRADKAMVDKAYRALMGDFVSSGKRS
jgi:hypothetical protein